MNIWNCITKNHNGNFHIIEVKPLWNFCTIQIILNVNSSSIASSFCTLIEVIPVKRKFTKLICVLSFVSPPLVSFDSV